MSEDRAIEKIRKLTEKKKSEKVARFLDDNDIEVEKAAIIGLGMIQDETSVNLLCRLIDDENPEIRKVSVKAFAKGQSEQAKTYIQHLIATDKDPSVVEVAKKELLEFKNLY